MSKKSDGSGTYTATVIVEPRGRGGATMIINGRSFVLRGAIVRGLRDLSEGSVDA